MRHSSSPASSFCRRIILLLGPLGSGWICHGPRGAGAAAFAAAPLGATPQRSRRHLWNRPTCHERDHRCAGTARYSGPRDDDGGAGGDGHGAGWNERLQEFLDQPFYDPDAVLRDLEARNASAGKGGGPSSWWLRFATFVKEDYETAEAMLVGAYMMGLVLLTQELVRHLYRHH